MRKQGHKNERHGARNTRGQGLVEGTVALCLIIPIGFMFIAGFVNLFAITTCSSKLNLIASETVKWRSENLYWMGMKRNDVDQDKATDSAQSMAIAMAAAAGIQLSKSDVVIQEVTLQGGGNSFPGEQCTITVRNFKAPFANIPGFPLLMPIASTVALSAAPVPPPGILGIDTNMNWPNPSGANACFYVPSYGAEYSPTNKPNGYAAPIPSMHYPQPDGSINNYPVVGIGNVGTYIDSNMPGSLPLGSYN
jgi:hypothetical protein